jgi:hypothetical protein
MNSGLNFGDALEILKAGGKVTRKNWNGAGMWVALSPGFELRADRIYSDPIAEFVGSGRGVFRAYLMMKTVDDEFVPWVASQTDLLAEDWEEVE